MTRRWLRNALLATLSVIVVGMVAQLARPWSYPLVCAYAVSVGLAAHMDAATADGES